MLMSAKKNSFLFLLLVMVSVISVAQPEVTVKGKGHEILDGAATWPDSTGQSFGVLQANIDAVTKTYWIYNTGTSDLTLSNFRVTAVYNTQFSITTPSNLVVSPGDSVYFNVVYAPIAAGTHGRTTGGSGVCVAAFDTDDADEPTYDFRISGVATADPAFDCSSGRMFFSHLGGGTDLKEWNYGNQPPTLNIISNALSWNHDGMALNPNDNYIYTIRYNSGSRNQLWALSSKGIATFVGYISGGGIGANMSSHAAGGAMDNSNNLYAFYNADATSSLRKINVRSQLAESITLSEPVYIRGAIYNPDDGLLYGFSAGATYDGLVSVDPSDGTVNYIGGDGDLTYAAMFRSTDGAVYMMSQTYSMYLVDLTNGSIEQIGTNPGWGNGTWVDGCACGEIKAEADVNITVNDNRPSYTPGTTQTYTITVKNNGPWGSYRDTVRNVLPTGVTIMNWTSTTFGTAVSDNASGTGALEDVIDLSVGDSVVYIVKVTVPLGFTGDLENTASVTASTIVSDPEMSNNSVTDTDVIFSLSTEQCDNGFDDDGDGDVDCFDGECNESPVCESHYTNGVIPDCPDTPDVALFSMREQYRTANNVGHGYATPSVGDLDGDGIPEIVTVNVNTERIYVANGQTGATITSIAYQQTYHIFAGGVAIADVDNDGTAEVFIVTGNATSGFDNNNSRQYISCYDYDNQTLTFRYRRGFGQNNRSEYDGQKYAVVQFVDFDQDGVTELFIGNHVMNASNGDIIASPTTAQRYTWPRGRYHSAVGQDEYMSAAYDILPDAFCPNCDGVEIIAGNTVYAVDLSDPTNNQNGITVAAQITPTGTYTDGLTSLADWDGDGEMDVIVVSRNAVTGSQVYIWNPRTQTIIDGPVDILPLDNNAAGRATVADFDGDGANELAIVSHNFLSIFESDFSVKWRSPSDDGSRRTSATAFDFEGDGDMEVVYRDETTLRIFDGITGAIKTSLSCGSGTRVEMPVIADVDADGEAEIICSCNNLGGAQRTVVFTSDQTPWLPTRKVWNSLHYAPTFINDDLTIPAQRQDKADIPRLDVYAAQAYITDTAGNIVYPALPDFVTTFDSATVTNCTDDSTLVYVTICNDDANALIYDYPISYYNGDPNSGGTLIGTRTVRNSDVTILSSNCYQYAFNAPNQPIDLYITPNDNGTGTFGYPTTSLEECDSTNNVANGEIGCPYDAEITKDDGEQHYIPGGARTYEIIARNNGPSFTDGIVSDPLPTGISVGDVTWTATTYGGATTTASGTMNGSLQDTVDIPGGDSIVYLVTISTPDDLTGDLVNLVSINVVGDTITNNNTATDTDTVDCTFAISGVVNSRTQNWTRIGTVVSGFTYNFNSAGGTKTFTATNGPEAGQEITTVVYNTGTGFSISMARNRYNNSNSYVGTITGTYDNSPHGWTGLSGTAPENAPILGFMAFIDRNGNGSYNSGTDDFIRDINSLTITPDNSGELYLAFYDNGSYADNNGVINIDASIDPTTVDFAVSDTLICDGDSVQLDAGNPGALSWDWSNGETSQSIQAKVTGEYSVIVTTPGGCTTTDTMNLIVGCETDLEATKTDGLSSYTRGANTVYTIIAKNNGPLDVENAAVTDPIPNGVNDFSWTAVLHGTAANTSGTSGSGGVLDTVDLAVGDSIVYTVTAAVSGTKYGDLINTVTIITPTGTPDSDSTNNIATDIDNDPDPSQCFIMMSDFEDYVNCPSIATQYDDFAAAYAGNSAWVNSKHTAGLFVNNIPVGGSCDNINFPGYDIPEPDVDGGTAYAGLHSPNSGGTQQEVIIGTLPTSLLANQEYEISFIGISILVRDQPQWNNYGEVDFFGIEDGANPVLNDATQTDWTTISAIPEVDYLGTSATIASRTEWNEYSFTFTPTRDLDRLLLAPRGASAYVGIDNIIVKVAAQTIDVDTVSVCKGTTVTSLPYAITSGNPTDYSIDWDDAANSVGIADVAQTTLPVGDEFTLSELVSVPPGNYTAEITAYNTPLGCESTDSILFIVDDSINVNLRSDTVLCLGDSVLVDAGNPEALEWNWNSGDTTQTIFIDSTGMYIVDVTTSSSCPSQKDTINVTVNSLPVVNLGEDTSICAVDSISFEGPLEGSYIWNTGEIISSITTDTAGIYHLTYTDTNNCINSDTVVLTIDTVPDVSLRDDTTFCEGGNVNIDAGNPGAIWFWNTGQSSQTIDADTSGTYRVIVSNTYNCVDSDSVKITVIPVPLVNIGPKDTSVCVENLYELDAGNTGAIFNWNTDEDEQIITPDTAGIYYVKVTFGTGCFATDTIKTDTFVTPLPNLNVPDTTICEGDSVVVDATEGFQSYSWTNDTSTSNSAVLNSTNKYVITVTNSNNCIGRDSLELTVNPLPLVDLSDSSLLCTYGGLILTVDETGADYAWSTGESDREIIANTLDTFWVKVTTAENCELSDTTIVYEDTLLIDLGEDASFCEGNSVLLDAGDFVTEIWNSSDTSSTFTIDESGTITVLAIDSEGCFGRDTIIVTQNPIPSLSLTQQDTAICDLIAETTSASVLNPEDMDITWSTGESGETTSIADTGWVKATKTNEFECSAKDSVFVDRECEDKTFTLPNIFTPDDDGTNETFIPIEDPITLSTYFNVIQFIVYNRWGRVVYMSRDKLPYWEGIYQDTGSPCPSGTYYWIVDYQTIYGEPKKLNGYVQLVRKSGT